MLSRVADSLYWMSRYLERAEHTARLLSVGLTQTLGQEQEAVRQRWLRLLAALHVTPPTGSDVDSTKLAQAQSFDTENRDALVSSITLARENARQVREQISTELWEQLNRPMRRHNSGRMSRSGSSSRLRRGHTSFRALPTRR
jgi:uncharacterized alpha-E superfamily protein